MEQHSFLAMQFLHIEPSPEKLVTIPDFIEQHSDALRKQQSNSQKYWQ